MKPACCSAHAGFATIMESYEKQIFILSLIIWCLSSALVCANVPLMPVEDIVPGMRGIAKTVIEGDTIEEFNIEVLGVIGNDAMGHNILD